MKTAGKGHGTEVETSTTCSFQRSINLTSGHRSAIRWAIALKSAFSFLLNSTAYKVGHTEAERLEVVVDYVLNELLGLFAVAYELTLRHIEPPLVGLDLIAFSLLLVR